MPDNIEINPPEMYSEEDMETVENYIDETFGKVESVFHELLSTHIHVDVHYIPPTPERNFITLVTTGMGAVPMELPEGRDPKDYSRAEVMICLPADWKLETAMGAVVKRNEEKGHRLKGMLKKLAHSLKNERQNDEKDYWPVRVLKNLTRFPIYCETWLGWGHDVDFGDPFAENTGFCSVLLLNNHFEGRERECRLTDGDRVNFYQVIPLYREEMEYKVEHGTQRLLYCFGDDEPWLVNIRRPNYGLPENVKIDKMYEHSAKITELGLPLDELAGAAHMAHFLRWCIEHDLVSDEVKNKASGDLRALIRDSYDGCLTMAMFNEAGREFVNFYYDCYGSEIDGEEYWYPADVDNTALEYFGEEKYNSEEFHDEAYLFVPYDDEYYKSISKKIDKAFSIYKENQ